MDAVNSHNDSSIFGRRLTRVMLLRVLLVSFFLGATLLLNISSLADLSTAQNTIYLALIVLTYLATILYSIIIRLHRPTRRLAHAQIVFDLLVATSLVSITGGYHSSLFLFTLYLPIIAAAFLTSLRAALLIATTVTFITLVTTLMYLDVLPSPSFLELTPVGSSPRTLWLEAALNISFTYLLAWSSGQLARQLGQAQTEIARSKLDIKTLQALNEDILASLNSGLLTVDHAMQIIFFNRAAEDITGFTHEQVIGKQLDLLFPELSAMLISTPHAQERHELRYTPPGQGEESSMFLGFSISPLRDTQGESTGHIIIFQDLTQYKELESLAKRNEKLAAIGQLSAAIAHEIRNPLASISGSVEMLQALSNLSEDEHALMQIVLHEVERLNKLISEFLNYTRPRELALEPTPICALMRDTLQLFRHHSHSIRLTLEQHIALAEEPTPLLDTEAVRSVIWNLLINAAQAMTPREATNPRDTPDPLATLPSMSTPLPSPATEPPERDAPCVDVRLGYEPDPGRIIIEIEDNGPGIDEGSLEHIFEPFFTTKEAGTGLGLATAYRIIEAHRGEILITTPRRLHGACFRLSFPYTPSPISPAPEA